MVETILSAVDEYQSAANGADISYKMSTKARNGGTLGRAPLGYLNKRDTSEGRNIGIVIFDEERAPYMKMAFELYATGEWSMEALQDELTQRGLQTRPGRYPEARSRPQNLRRCYATRTTSDTSRTRVRSSKGRHEPLISQELFDQVQSIMDERSGNGARQRRHHHFLKGMLWCGRCQEQGIESRMLMQWSKGTVGVSLLLLSRASSISATLAIWKAKRSRRQSSGSTRASTSMLSWPTGSGLQCKKPWTSANKLLGCWPGS